MSYWFLKSSGFGFEPTRRPYESHMQPFTLYRNITKKNGG
jgi:hypothetical protein